MSVKIKKIQDWMESRFPLSWAEDWDRLGLQLGDPEQEVKRIGISLEATPHSVSWAVKNNLQLMICHHPLFFQPIDSLNKNQEPGRTASLMVKQDISLLVAHTNLDAAPEGVSTALGRRLGLIDLIPIEKRSQDVVKLVLFVPIGYEEKIIKVLDVQNTGRIGSYRLCTFKSRGEGTFVPEKGSRPFQGEIGQMQRVSEWRLEVSSSRATIYELIEKIRSVHPYEEMAYDIYSVESPSAEVGFGRVGRFDPPISWETLLLRLKQEVEAPQVRVSGPIPDKIQKTAVCGGSGGRLILKALSTGAELLICGEIGFHPVVSHQGQAMTLIEIGHYPSEKWVIPILAEAMWESSRADGWGVEIFENREPGDPYTQYF